MLCGLGLLFEFIGFYNNNHDVTLKERKKDFAKAVLEKKLHFKDRIQQNPFMAFISRYLTTIFAYYNIRAENKS